MASVTRVARLALAAASLALCLAFPAHAADEPDARALFAAGTAAAAQADCRSALRYFSAARDAGLDGPAVHYNIGVCAWTLGDLDLAEQAFLEAAGVPAMAPLAHYNLGLIERRRGDTGAARAWFSQALQGADDAGDAAVRQLATAGLASLPQAPPVPPTSREPAVTRRPTAAFVAAAAGYDDNVALLADGDLLGVSRLDSPYAEVQAALSAPLYTDLGVNAGIFLVEYGDLPEFDQRSAQVELVYAPRVAAWRLELGGGYSLNQLDGERFEDQRSLLAGASRPLGRDWRLRVRLRYADIDGSAPYGGLTGDRIEAGLRLQRHTGPHRIQAEYRLELNDRAADELSPDRHRIDVEWRHGLSRGLSATLNAGWRHSRYHAAGLSRTERRTTLGAGLGGPIGPRWEWVLRYERADNSASLPEFEYDRNRLFAGVQAAF